MKKVAILTSVLALAACGGGSGNNAGDTPNDINNPETINSGDVLGNIGGITGNLPDNQFLADIVFTANDGDDGLRFNIQDGKIVSITDHIGSDHDLVFKYIGDNKFRLESVPLREWYLDMTDEEISNMYNTMNNFVISKLGEGIHGWNTGIMVNSEISIEQVKTQMIENVLANIKNVTITDEVRDFIRAQFDALDNSKFGHFVVNSANMVMDSMGKAAGLSFADFGHYATYVTGTDNGIAFQETEHDIYVGGPDYKKVETPSENMIFNGKAVLAINIYNDKDLIDDSMFSKTDQANLELKDGKEILTMNFSAGSTPWYDMVATKSISDPSIHSLVIDNNATASAQVNEKFRITDDMATEANDYHHFETGYYGDGGSASEAIGCVTTDIDVPSENAELEISASFGGIK